MKLVFRATTPEGANEIRSLLENAGIPASITNTNFASINLSFIPGSLGVFIYNPDQYQDAVTLINNRNHVVKNPVDVEAFYDSLNSEQHTNDAYRAMNSFIRGMIAFGLICGFLIYMLS